MNRDALYYLERLDAFAIMETHIMDRVMQEYWQSSLDAGGSIFDSSTPHRILNHMDDRFQVDCESENRFYKNRVTFSHAHQYSFMVVRKSMQTRYYIEMFFFFGVVCAFQAYLLFFISDYN